MRAGKPWNTTGPASESEVIDLQSTWESWLHDPKWAATLQPYPVTCRA